MQKTALFFLVALPIITYASDGSMSTSMASANSLSSCGSPSSCSSFDTPRFRFLDVLCCVSRRKKPEDQQRVSSPTNYRLPLPIGCPKNRHIVSPRTEQIFKFINFDGTSDPEDSDA